MDFTRDFVKVPRAVLRELLRDDTALRVYLLCLDRAAYQAGPRMVRGHLEHLEVGQAVLGRAEIANQLNASESTIRTAISSLQNLQLITTKSTNRGTLVTVCGYAENGGATSAKKPADPPADQPADRPAIDQQTSQPTASRLTTNRDLRSEIREGREGETRARGDAPTPTPSGAQTPAPRDLTAQLEATLQIAKQSGGAGVAAAGRDAQLGVVARRLYDRLSHARVTLGKRFGITPEPLPFPPIGIPSSKARGWIDVRERLREEGDQAELVAERVYEHLVKQAEEQRSVDWLSEKAFTAGAWQTAREGRGRRDNVVSIASYPQQLKVKGYDEDRPPPLPHFLRGKP